MNYDVRQMLKDFTSGLTIMGRTHDKEVNAFLGMLGTNYAPGAVDVKTKELASVAIAVFSRCEYCIVYHTYKALEAGANRDEIIEIAMIAVAFGGGPSMAYSVTLLHESIQEFEKDFQ